MSGRVTDLAVDAGGVAVLTMRDAPKKNALSAEMVAELESHLAAVQRRDDVKVLVVAGTEEHFSTGANRAALEEIVAGRVAPRDLWLPRLLLDVPVPVIAAMAGHALGGGLALALCADITIAARESRYGATFMRYGFTPGLGITRLLEYAMGPFVAHELLLTGSTFRGSRFERHGAFTYVLPRSEVVPRALALAADLAAKPRLPLTMLKAALSKRRRELFEAARAQEGVMHEATFATSDVARLIQELD